MKWICRLLVFLALSALAAKLPQAEPVFEDSMAQRLLACTGCHGAQGQAGPDGYYPRLAGKPLGYLHHQLQNFQTGRRHYPLMRGLLQPLDDAYLQTMAAHFAALSVPYAAPKPSVASAQVLALGRTLVLQGRPAQGLPACADCHGQALMGIGPDLPGLLGLPADYLNAQLGGWQTGQRRAAAPDCMARVAALLSPADIYALAQWLSSQPVPAHSAAADTRTRVVRGSTDFACGSAP